MAFRLVLVELQRPLAERYAFVAVIFAGPLVERRYRARQPGVGPTVLRVFVDGEPEPVRRLLGVVARDAAESMMLEPAQQAIVGVHIRRDLLLGRDQALVLQAPDDGDDNRFRQLVLYGEEFGQRAVVLVRPDMIAARSIDELTGNPNLLAHLAHAALETVGNPEFLADLARIDVAALEREAGIARGHEQFVEAGQLGDQVLGKAVGEVGLVRVVAEHCER